MTQLAILGVLGSLTWLFTVLVLNDPPWQAFEGIGFWVIVLAVICIIYEKWQAHKQRVIELESRVRELEGRD